jgi:putative transposase
MTAKRDIVPGEYYHIYNRGTRKAGLFLDSRDWARFLFGVLYFQSPTPFPQVGRLSKTYTSSEGFSVPDRDFANVLNGRSVELVSFCLMGNHFHLIVRELVEGGISRYMQRIELAYTRYFNTKYSMSGHVFQGRYRTVHVADNEQLMHLSAYIHRNPRELKVWKDKEERYPWSSYQDYVTENRWGGLLAQEIILDQFEGTDKSNYADFVKTSPAKELV